MHYYGFVIVPNAQMLNAEAYVARKMAPYDENQEFPEHDTDCHCLGDVASRYATTQVDKKFGSWQAVRAKHDLHQKTEEKPLSWHDYLETQPGYNHEERAAFHALVVNEHSEKDMPDPACVSCAGTGSYRSTDNPNEKWDWYRIGGRWDGHITNNPQFSEHGFNYNKKHETVGNNSRSVSAFLEDLPDPDKKGTLIPGNIITPDGKWHEQPEDQPDESWEEEAKLILENYPDHTIITIDCHT